MSGSSWSYVYRTFQETADRLKAEIRYDAPMPNVERVALGLLIDRIAKAMHDIEWVDSCDYALGDELPAIKAVLDRSGDGGVPEEIRYMAARFAAEMMKPAGTEKK